MALMKVLILGISGLIGNGIASVISKDKSKTLIGTYCKNKHYHQLSDNRFHHFDILKDDSLFEFIHKIEPDFIINCLGITKHLQRSYSEDSIFNVNSYFPINLSKICEEKKINLIHISTDCVFDGKNGNYSELDSPNAIDIYGYSKSLSEKINNNHLVLRTSTVGKEINTKYGLLEWFLSLEESCEGYKNAFFSGITTIELGKIILNNFLSKNNQKGLFNIGGNRINKYELLTYFSKYFKKKITIVENYSFQIDRSLNNAKFKSKFNYQFKEWDTMLNEMNNIEN